VRHEIGTGAIAIGQIAQIKMSFRLLKQQNGSFTFRQLLKGIYVLHDGMSMVRNSSKLLRLASANDPCRKLPVILLPAHLQNNPVGVVR